MQFEVFSNELVMNIKVSIFIATLLDLLLVPSSLSAPFPADQVDPAITVYHKVNKLSKEDLEHGRIETEKMLQALPEMRVWARTSKSPFYRFAVRQYAGEALGWWLYWKVGTDKLSDEYYSPSACLSPTPRRHGEIEISKLTDVSAKDRAEHYWSCFVFESFNIRNAPSDRQLWHDAAMGKVNRQQFIKKRAESEIQPGTKTSEYFFRAVKPWATLNKTSVHPKF